MAENKAEISVSSQLGKIVEDLQKIAKAQEQVSRGLREGNEDVGKALEETTKKTLSGLEKLKKFGIGVAKSLKDDFSALASINSLTGALKLSNQFSGSVKEAMGLSDAIRKVGMTFGVAQKDFSKFQSSLISGLGEVGLSSEVATKTLQALAQTPVRGTKNIIGYSKAAGELASIGQEKGQEGDIAGGLSRVIQARGGNVNDANQMQELAESVRKITVGTGKGPAEVIKSMEDLFTGMSKDMRAKISPKGIANLASAEQVAGPNATAFIQQYLSLSKTQRAGMDARGVGQIFGQNGINTDQVSKLYKNAQSLGGGDARLGVKAATGIDSDEAAEGFIRLAESLDKVKAAQERIKNTTGSLEQQYKSSMGAEEAFQASINRVKATIAGPLSSITQGGTDLLAHAAQSTGGSAAVVGGGALLAAVLAGRGLKGIGKGMGVGGLIQSKAEEAITGEKVIPVRVVNAGEIGGGGGGTGGAGLLGKAGAVAGAGAAGVAIGSVVEGYIQENTQGKTSEGFEGNAVERLIFKLDQLMGGANAKNIVAAGKGVHVKVDVDLKSKDLKHAVPPGRGMSQ